MKENRRMSTYNQLKLQTLGCQPVMPKNLPNHCTLEEIVSKSTLLFGDRTQENA
jgi:hypothetical protein